MKDERPDHRFEDTYRIAAQDPFDSVSMAVENYRAKSAGLLTYGVFESCGTGGPSGT